MIKSLRKLAEWIFVGLLVYMPFHVFLSTWLGTSFGVLTALKILKDIILVVGFLMALASVDKAVVNKLAKDKLVWLIAAYGILTVGLALARPTEQDAEVLGVVYNLRFLVFFLYGALIVSWNKQKDFLRKAVKLVLAAGLIVAALGVVQYFLLPNDALSHFGYSKPNGTPPAFFIDDKPDLERVMSTVKDPNSLGSYLIIIVSLLLVGVVAAKSRLKRKYLLATVLALVCLWLTFSRGALIGLVLAIGVWVLLQPQALAYMRKRKKIIALLAVATLCVVTGVLVLGRDTYLVKNVVFHADDSTVLESSNDLRIRFWRESVLAVIDDPVGSGPGTAGIVSIRNSQGGELNENYYLQIASEVGVVGLALFAAILGVVTERLYRVREKSAGLGLFASWVGLAFTSLLVHTWSNEVVAYTWWGLAGIVIFGVSEQLTIPKTVVRK